MVPVVAAAVTAVAVAEKGSNTMMNIPACLAASPKGLLQPVGLQSKQQVHVASLLHDAHEERSCCAFRPRLPRGRLTNRMNKQTDDRAAAPARATKLS
jgi:hypothetical protein